MSGGGSSGSKSSGGKSDKNKPEPPQPGTTVQPFTPGMDVALAQQLAMGYGGNPQDFMAAFQQTYAPMQVPSNATYQVPPKPGKTPKAPRSTPNPGTSVPSTGGGGGSGLGGLIDNYQWGGNR